MERGHRGPGGCCELQGGWGEEQSQLSVEAVLWQRGRMLRGRGGRGEGLTLT